MNNGRNKFVDTKIGFSTISTFKKNIKKTTPGACDSGTIRNKEKYEEKHKKEKYWKLVFHPSC